MWHCAGDYSIDDSWQQSGKENIFGES